MPRYWIKSAGTVEEPVPADWYRWGKNPHGGFGDPNLFSRRPRVEPSDRLVFYAVGSVAQFKAGRIFAVVPSGTEIEIELLSEAEDAGVRQSLVRLATSTPGVERLELLDRDPLDPPR